MRQLKGKIWVFGDDIDTDAIIPARHLNTTVPRELALHCMEDADPTFAEKVGEGDIIVAGSNFGCGSSREHAPIAIKAAKVGCVIAESFARIFYRNAINIGLPILECPEAVREAKEGHEVAVDLARGLVSNVTLQRTYNAVAFPEFMQAIIGAGGLIDFVKEGLEEGSRHG